MICDAVQDPGNHMYNVYGCDNGDEDEYRLNVNNKKYCSRL